jgi:dolichol-phosphate mannosyltransferase
MGVPAYAAHPWDEAVEPRVSIVVPAYDEGDEVVPVITRLLDAVRLPCEVLVVVDDEDDSTLPPVRSLAEREPRVKPVVSSYGRGPARAIRFGFDRSVAPVVVVSMADGSDAPEHIDALVRLVERGVVIACASRYAPSGQQVGGPHLKRTLSRMAGLSLWLFARVGTRDATNSFKAYSTHWVRSVGIESDRGFELALELVAKARRTRQPVAELPTVWLDRTSGKSTFDLRRFLPGYLRWYRYAFGRRLPVTPAAMPLSVTR